MNIDAVDWVDKRIVRIYWQLRKYKEHRHSTARFVHAIHTDMRLLEGEQIDVHNGL